MTCQNLLRGATIHIETIKDNKAQSLMKENPSRQDCGVCAESQMGFSKVLLITLMMVMMMIRRMMMMMATMIVACVRDPRIGFSKVEQILPSLPAISSQEQVIGSQNCQNHKYHNVGDKFSESLTFFILPGWGQHAEKLDTDE